MISLVILLFVFMGLIQASLLSINSNLRNEIRDESVKIASEYMSMARSTPSVDTLAAVVCNSAVPTFTTATFNVSRNVRNFSQSYTVTRSSCFTDTAQNDVRVTVRVDYVYPNETDTNTQSATSIVKRQ